MTRSELEKTISDCCNDVSFTYNGVPSGVTSEVHDYIPTFHAWYGEKIRAYNNIEDVMSDEFYGGKSLNDLVGIVEFWIS